MHNLFVLGEGLQVDSNLYFTKVLFHEGIDKKQKNPFQFHSFNIYSNTFYISVESSSTYVGSNFQR
jgi:hypothetical protein